MSTESDLQHALIIPPDKLSSTALNGLIEEFILREGTDYGVKEHTLDEKRNQVLKQLTNGHVYIVYDTAEESTSILRKEHLPKMLFDNL